MKCPYCNLFLNITEYIEYEAINIGELNATVAGFCPKCKHKYLWTQYYTLVNESDLEDDE